MGPVDPEIPVFLAVPGGLRVPAHQVCLWVPGVGEYVCMFIILQSSSFYYVVVTLGPLFPLAPVGPTAPF